MDRINGSKTAASRISVGIVAGGKSSRMGQDKALVRIGNERFMDRLLKEFGGHFEVLISAANKDAYAFTGYPVVCDENREIGPIEGIRRLLMEASGEYVFVCAVDMPFVKKELLLYLAEFICSDYDCYVIADEEHIQPLCAIYKKSVLPELEELIREGRYRLREVFGRVRTKYVPLAFSCFDRSMVRNINTREELREAEPPFIFCVSGFSDSGKTGLIERLINEFKQAGLRTAVIKHDGHDCFSDVPGSDTDRFRQAGAECFAVFSDSRCAVTVREHVEAEELAGLLVRLYKGIDILVIEGLKASGYPKVEVVRKGIFEQSVCDPASLICVVSDCVASEEVSCPVFGLKQYREIFLCILAYSKKGT